MPIFVWNDSYSVNVAQYDAQHRNLFAIINELFDAMSTGKGQRVVGTTVSRLAAYTDTHFRAEEEVLRRLKYPSLPLHENEHRKFVAELDKLKQESSLGSPAAPIALLEFLRDWLVEHIKKTDRQYSRHLNERGIS